MLRNLKLEPPVKYDEAAAEARAGTGMGTRESRNGDSSTAPREKIDERRVNGAASEQSTSGTHKVPAAATATENGTKFNGQTTTGGNGPVRTSEECGAEETNKIQVPKKYTWFSLYDDQSARASLRRLGSVDRLDRSHRGGGGVAGKGGESVDGRSDNSGRRMARGPKHEGKKGDRTGNSNHGGWKWGWGRKGSSGSGSMASETHTADPAAVTSGGDVGGKREPMKHSAFERIGDGVLPGRQKEEEKEEEEWMREKQESADAVEREAERRRRRQQRPKQRLRRKDVYSYFAMPLVRALEAQAGTKAWLRKVLGCYWHSSAFVLSVL